MKTPLIERRKNVNSMTDEQFRDYCARQFEEQAKTNKLLVEMLDENTQHTKRIDESTQGLVSVINFSEVGARRIIKTAKFMRILAKFVTPFVVLYGIIAGIKHGHVPFIKDLLE